MMTFNRNNSQSRKWYRQILKMTYRKLRQKITPSRDL